ncbi:hypothetical protein MMC21_006623 [Puttea exsequens]|nr:hypothetical protein [Puttea exsequens]
MSSSKPTVAELVQRNKDLQPTYKHIANLSELPAKGIAPPSILISPSPSPFPSKDPINTLPPVTCADPRCIPEQFLGLKPIEAIVIRNACGHVAPALDSILALDVLLGGFAEAMIVHHTDCGASHYTNEMIRGALKGRVGDGYGVDEMDFGAVTNIEQSVKDDLAVLKANPLVRPELKEKTYGFVLQLETGLLSAV